jgi:hypothetical protein
MLRTAIALCCLLPIAASASGVVTSESSTTSNSTAVNSGNNQTLTVNSGPGTVQYGGSYSVKSTGAAVLPGFAGSFSSDYCGGTSGAAAAGVGFGLSFGAPKIDPSCVMLRTYERIMQAAASEKQPMRRESLRLAALEVLTHIDPKVRDIFDRLRLLNPEQRIPLEIDGTQQ